MSLKHGKQTGSQLATASQLTTRFQNELDLRAQANVNTALIKISEIKHRLLDLQNRTKDTPLTAKEIIAVNGFLGAIAKPLAAVRINATLYLAQNPKEENKGVSSKFHAYVSEWNQLIATQISFINMMKAIKKEAENEKTTVKIEGGEDDQAKTKVIAILDKFLKVANELRFEDQLRDILKCIKNGSNTQMRACSDLKKFIEQTSELHKDWYKLTGGKSVILDRSDFPKSERVQKGKGALYLGIGYDEVKPSITETQLQTTKFSTQEITSKILRSLTFFGPKVSQVIESFEKLDNSIKEYKGTDNAFIELMKAELNLPKSIDTSKTKESLTKLLADFKEICKTSNKEQNEIKGYEDSVINIINHLKTTFNDVNNVFFELISTLISENKNQQSKPTKILEKIFKNDKKAVKTLNKFLSKKNRDQKDSNIQPLIQPVKEIILGSNLQSAVLIAISVSVDSATKAYSGQEKGSVLSLLNAIKEACTEKEKAVAEAREKKEEESKTESP